jgi:hypothetical protein
LFDDLMVRTYTVLVAAATVSLRRLSIRVIGGVGMVSQALMPGLPVGEAMPGKLPEFIVLTWHQF